MNNKRKENKNHNTSKIFYLKETAATVTKTLTTFKSSGVPCTNP